jgi:hypothetical protein
VLASRDTLTGEAIIQLPGVKYFADDCEGIQREKAIKWIFPQGYDTPGFHERAIIAGMFSKIMPYQCDHLNTLQQRTKEWTNGTSPFKARTLCLS